MSRSSPASVLRWLFDSEHGASGRLLPRWIFLRALGLIYYSVFFSLVFQIRGLIGPQGILPAGEYLEAGFIAFFFAPAGFRPGWGEESRPPRASLFLLVWEGFRIYFESGVAKIMGGDPQWRNFTALDEYYQNGPLPTWIGWYMQHFPHWFHAATSFFTLALELVLVWAVFLPRRIRIICFLIITPWQVGIILSANYTFLNYLVLALGFLLLDDQFVLRYLPSFWKKSYLATKEV